MPRRDLIVVTAIVITLAAAITGTVLIASSGDRGESNAKGRTAETTRQPQRRKTYAELTAANYKTLKPAQTRSLLRYADAAYACMSKQLDLGKPQPSPTRIVMALPRGTKAHVVARMGIRCSMTIGNPPSASSFQVRGDAVILYLPKYCILDKKTVTRSRAGTSP